MGSEHVSDFLFVGLSVLPTGLFAAGYPLVALVIFFPLLIGACLSGTGPCEPEEKGADELSDTDIEVH